MYYTIKKNNRPNNKKPRRSLKTQIVYLDNKSYEISHEIFDYIQKLEMEKYSKFYTWDEWEKMQRRGGFSAIN